MAIDSEAKRWGMLQLAGGPSVYGVLINPDGSDADDVVERASFLKIYGGIALGEPVAASSSTGLIQSTVQSTVRSIVQNTVG